MTKGLRGKRGISGKIADRSHECSKTRTKKDISAFFRRFRVLRVNPSSLWPAIQALYFIGRQPYPMPMTSFNLNASYYYGFFGYTSGARRRA
jgi:hypothetical protein